MQRVFLLIGVATMLVACVSNEGDAKASAAVGLSATTGSLAVINIVGMDTLSDSASIHQLHPEPDGGSIAFLFADPAKGIRSGLGLVEASGATTAQLAWPDSVISFWWSGSHQLSFTAGTGQGVRIVVDAHAAQLQSLEATHSQARTSSTASATQPNTAALSRAQTFIDSIRVQPEGTLQEGSTLRYQADSIIIAPGDTFVAVHVSAQNSQGTKANPAWYLAHLPSGHMHPVDSLTGTSSGLPASAGQWGLDGMFYYAKERSIWRAQPRVR